MTWTRAKDLENWADELSARGLLPLLVRKLIMHTVSGLSKFNIPAQEQIGRPGFDGIVEVIQGNRYVPSGQSLWEMGVDQDVQRKAEADFKKRLADASAETTFVFVTPRNWPGKDKWAANKTSSGWKSVVAYDANDIEHWLEMTRGVDSWISTLTRRIPPGLQSLETHWQGLSAIAAHQLTPSVFIASRDSEITELLRWLSGHPDSLFLRSAALDDGIDFLAAIAAEETQKLMGDHPVVPSAAQNCLQDAIIVHTAQEWRQLAIAGGSLLLVQSPTLVLGTADIAVAIRAGHYVFVSGPRGIVPMERAIQLRGLASFELEQSLQASGFSNSEAGNFARGSCGSSTILKRLITQHPDTNFPEWSRGNVVGRLAPFVLVGGWHHVDPAPRKESDSPSVFHSRRPIDVDVVTELVGCSRDELDELVTRLSNSEEPFFVRFGDRILVTSREDAWHLLGHAVTDLQLQRFASLAGLVLDEDNPAFELDKDTRWIASIYGKSHSISTELRRSLVESLALMAIYPTLAGPKRDSVYAATVQEVIETALPPGAGWQRWASLGENIQTIAETAPEVFLLRVEEDLKSETPVLPQLFTESMGGFTGGKLDCDLLWALEILSWSPEYLERSAVALVKLISLIPPKDNYHNRPENSLREIFLLWLWHTNATTEQRVTALNAVLRAAPDAGWQLLKELLPSGYRNMSYNTAMPRWRNWADGWSREAIQPHRREYTLSVANLVIQMAASDPQRWADVVEGILKISDEITVETISALEKLVEQFKHDTDSVFALWIALRTMIAHHEQFEEADWAFDSSLLSRLSQIRDALAPVDPVLKYQWMFEPGAELPEPNILEDCVAHDKALVDTRRQALREIVEAKGSLGVFRILDLDADANVVGWLLAEGRMLDWDVITLPQLLTDACSSYHQFADSYISTAFSLDGWAFVKSLPASRWTPQELGMLALALPFRKDVWEWVAGLGKEVEEKYWQRTQQFLRNVSLEDLEFAIHSLIQRGRSISAIRQLRSPLLKQLEIPSAMIGLVLESGFTQSAEGDVQDSSGLAYDVQQLIKTLQQDETFDRLRLASIEWGYLPLLDRGRSDVGPDTLAMAITKDPQLFVSMIATIYRGENDEPGPHVSSEQEKIRARRAHEFLDGLDALPGLLEKGTLDAETLKIWVTNVRRLATESGHARICESILGQLVARVIQGHLDESWISSEVAPFLESIATEEFVNGIAMGLFNARGTTWRGSLDGGKQERELESQFRERARIVRKVSPQLATVFESLAKSYLSQAQREDEEAERLRLGR